jgi:N-methylhydantoinase A
MDMRYEAQEYTLAIPMDSSTAPQAPGFVEEMARRFNQAHDFRYGHSNPGAPIEFVAVRAAALGDLGHADPEPVAAGERQPSGRVRNVIFDRKEWPTTVVDRRDLAAGSVLEGPAIVEEGTATTVVPPGCSLSVDRFGSLVVRTGKDS